MVYWLNMFEIDSSCVQNTFLEQPSSARYFEQPSSARHFEQPSSVRCFEQPSSARYFEQPSSARYFESQNIGKQKCVYLFRIKILKVLNRIVNIGLVYLYPGEIKIVT